MQEDDYPDEEWVDVSDSAGDDLLVCPSCGTAVHEDTQQCPHCGDWITPVYPERRWKKRVWIAAAALVILAFVWMTVF